VFVKSLIKIIIRYKIIKSSVETRVRHYQIKRSIKMTKLVLILLNIITKLEKCLETINLVKTSKITKAQEKDLLNLETNLKEMLQDSKDLKSKLSEPKVVFKDKFKTYIISLLGVITFYFLARKFAPKWLEPVTGYYLSYLGTVIIKILCLGFVILLTIVFFGDIIIDLSVEIIKGSFGQYFLSLLVWFMDLETLNYVRELLNYTYLFLYDLISGCFGSNEHHEIKQLDYKDLIEDLDKKEDLYKKENLDQEEDTDDSSTLKKVENIRNNSCYKSIFFNFKE
jgi:hypothetical protein